MTPEEIAARTRLEQEAGRNALRRFASLSPAMQERYMADFVPAEELAHLLIDPDVKLPDDVQAKIARGKATYRKFKKSWPKQELIRLKGPAGGPFLITSVVKKEVQERRDAALSALENQSEGKRGQPPMLFLRRIVLALVDRRRAKRVPFGTGPNSRMNKFVREDLNKMVARSRDSRKSRSKQVTAGALRYVLRQIKGLVD